MPHLLQINYKFSVPRADFGGIYLFDDEESARAYLEGPIIAAMKSLPILSELSVTSSSVLEEPTAITRGPIEETLVRR